MKLEMQTHVDNLISSQLKRKLRRLKTKAGGQSLFRRIIIITQRMKNPLETTENYAVEGER